MEDGGAQDSAASLSDASDPPFENTQAVRPASETRSGQACNFLDLLVREVPYDYKLKKYRGRKAPQEPLAYEVDDSHRFRNSISFTKSGCLTIQSLSGSRSSTMRDFMKKRQAEADIGNRYKQGRQGPQKDDILYPVDIVEWERDIEEWDGGCIPSSEEFSNEEDSSAGWGGKAANAGAGWAAGNAGSWEDKAHTASTEKIADKEMSSTDKENSGLEKMANDLAAKANPSYLTASNSIATREYINNLLSVDWEKEVIYDEVPAQKSSLTLFVDDPNLIFERVEEKRRGKSKRKNAVDKLSKNKYNIGNDKYYLPEGKKVSLGTFGVQHSLPALRLDERFYRANHTREELQRFHKPVLRLENKEYAFVSMPSPDRAAHGVTIKHCNELTLADQSPFNILEYAEEDPFFIVNPGMVSLLNRYYRNSEGVDESAPEGCIVLEHDEDAPFFGFGDVRPGTFVQTIANNLFIAPLYSHKVSDLLCIVQDNAIIARPIDTVFLVGQEFPKEEVFAPHSRKLNQFCKDRLKAASHRAFAKGKCLLMSDLDAMFPYFSEGSKRKWLKEYADCVKRGRDNVWVLREPGLVMNDEDLRKLVTPEDICQYESMLASERKMQDLGIRCSENDEDDDDAGCYASSWALSKNFVNAVNGRGLLELSRDDGDSGDAFFSFRRIKLRKGNEAENRKILSEHQASYKERIDKIWARQIEFLASTEAPECAPRKPVIESETVDESVMLTITRTYNEDGKTVERTEKIYDPRLIRAYLKARRRTTTTSEKKGALTCSNCGQSGHMKTNKSCPNYVNARSTKKKYESEKRRARIFMQDAMNRLLTRFMNVPFSNAFHKPVSLKKFPNYAMLVKNPIDFGTIRTNIRNFKYKKFADFVDEFKLMLDNCIIYNGQSHSLTEIAENIYKDARRYAEENDAQIKEAENMLELVE